MIKVIGKKTEEPKIYKVTCGKCGVQLECEYEDIYEGAYGLYYVRCPECGKEEMVCEIDGVELDEHNIKYPKHFSEMDKDAVDISDEKIQHWVRECLTRLKGYEDGDYALCGSGNTMVFAFKCTEEYVVYVAKNYSETSITRM
jgi:transcription elongation factor Elf1